jgi:hypothetical protein
MLCVDQNIVQDTLIMIVIVRDVKRAVVLDTIPKRSRARASGQCDEDPGQSEVPVASQFGMPSLHSAQVDRRGHDLLLTSMSLPRWRAVDQHFVEFWHARHRCRERADAGP